MIPGHVFAHDFRIIRPIGRGGMGAVYLALQLSTGRKRALKVLNPGVIHDPRIREHFSAEARIAAKLDTDHIADVVASGIDVETGAPWMATEYLEGETLEARVKRSGRLPPLETLEILRQICHAVGHAHAAGLVHRDLKPANLFVADPRRDGVLFTIKVLDFGIAKLIEGDASANTSAPIGSPMWMAPEQCHHHHAAPTTDVWALGLVAFFCLVGRPFWTADASHGLTTLLTEILSSEIPKASERAWHYGASVPNGFDDWFARCVARDPALRFPDARHALEGLAAWAASAQLPLPPVPPGRVPPERVTQSLGNLAPRDNEPSGSIPHQTTHGTLRPLAGAESRAGSPSRKPLLAAVGAAIVLAGAVLLLVGGAGAVAYYSGALSAFDPSAGTVSDPATPAPAASSAPEVATAAPSAPSTPSTTTSRSASTATPPTRSTPPAATSEPQPPTPASAAAPAAASGPTAAQVGGFRALVASCWKNNEGAKATAPATVSITVGVDGGGVVRSVRIDNAASFPGLRRCTVQQGSSYPGFKNPPPTWSSTTFSVSLPAAS